LYVCLQYSCIYIGDSYITTWYGSTTVFNHTMEKVGSPINRLSPATFLVPVPSQDLDFHRYISWSFCVQWVKMRGGWSFCWYWWNFLASFFQLSFHIISMIENRCTSISGGDVRVSYVNTWILQTHIQYKAVPLKGSQKKKKL
jgi:hypothetical protein